MTKFPQKTKDSDVRKCFGRFGKVNEIKSIVNKKNRKRDECYLVKFKEPVSKSILECTHKLLGQEVKVREFFLEKETLDLRAEREKLLRVFIGGLPKSMDNKAFKAYFQ